MLEFFKSNGGAVTILVVALIAVPLAFFLFCCVGMPLLGAIVGPQ